MKFSEAMLKGFEMVDGRQCRGIDHIYEDGKAVASCAIGAAYDGGFAMNRPILGPMRRVWGFDPVDLNDDFGMPWEHIYGMAVAAGL